jgi:hypothetical protein
MGVSRLSHTTQDCTGDNMTPCVCVFKNLRESGTHKTEKEKSHEGNTCDLTHTARLDLFGRYTTTILMQSTSSSIVDVTLSTSSLLVDSWGSQ